MSTRSKIQAAFKADPSSLKLTCAEFKRVFEIVCPPSEFSRARADWYRRNPVAADEAPAKTLAPAATTAPREKRKYTKKEASVGRPARSVVYQTLFVKDLSGVSTQKDAEVYVTALQDFVQALNSQERHNLEVIQLKQPNQVEIRRKA